MTLLKLNPQRSGDIINTSSSILFADWQLTQKFSVMELE
jgi:hypothetical protein